MNLPAIVTFDDPATGIEYVSAIPTFQLTQDTTKNVVLNPPATVVGTVVDESGSPVPGAWVRTSGEAGSSTQNTNSSGQFSIPAPSGNTRLAVIYPLPGDDMFVESGFFAANGITDLGTLAQPATSLLTVQVKDAAGDLVTGARVTSQGQYFTRSGGSFGNITLGGVYASFEGTTNSIGESTVRLPQGVVSSMNLPAIVTFDDPATGIEYVSAIPTFQLTQDTTKSIDLDYLPPPPNTTITAGPAPGSSTSDATPTFRFTSSEAGSTFQCRLDTATTWTTCTTPFTTGVLTEGTHTFRVRAKDAGGNIDPTPAYRTFTADTTGPDTSITAGPAPGSSTSDATPTFRFTSSEAGSTFQCRLDTATTWTTCTTPFTTGVLTEGTHTFRVRAKDAGGNIDPTAAYRTFTADTTGPDTSITAGPAPGSSTSDATPTFRFTSSEAGSTFQCRLDTATTWTTCTTPFTTGVRPRAPTPSVFAPRTLAATSTPPPPTAPSPPTQQDLTRRSRLAPHRDLRLRTRRRRSDSPQAKPVLRSSAGSIPPRLGPPARPRSRPAS